MSQDIGSLIATIGADISSLKKSVNKANSELEKYGKKTNSELDKVNSLWKGSGKVIAGAAATIGVAFSAVKFAGFIKDTAMAAARYETLGVVMQNIGAHAGYTTDELNKQAEAVRKSGITMAVSREAVIKLIQAHIDLRHASKLARIAQDAAVIGNINSSEALERLLYGIQSANLVVLKTIGINVQWEASYKKMAKQLNKTTDDLTDTEKAQARLAAVFERGKDITGAYESAMTTAGKKITSFARYVDDFKVKMGEAFGPATVVLVDKATEAMKHFADQITKEETQQALEDIANGIAAVGSSFVSLSMKAANALKYLALRSPGEVYSQAAVLAHKGLLDMARFEKMTLLERQKYVDAVIKKQKEEEISLKSVTGQIRYQREQWEMMKKPIEVTNNYMKELNDTTKNTLDTLSQFTLDDKLSSGLDTLFNGIEEKEKELKRKKIDLSGLFTPLGKDEFERDQEMFTKMEADYEKRLLLEKEFNDKYAELGLNKFDLERLQLERQMEIYRKAGFDKNRIEEMTSKRSKEIALAEQAAKLEIYQSIAGGIANTFKSITEAGGKQSKKAFEIYKAFAMVEAGIAGYSAVLKAMSAYPPPYSFIMAGIAGAAAAVQIGLIAASQPPSYDQGGISNAKGIYQTGDIAEAHIPIPSGGKIPVKMDDSKNKAVQIILQNPVFQDLETQKQTMAQIASIVAKQVAPGAVIDNYNNDGPIRTMVRNGV